MKVEHNVDLAKYTTIKIGGTAEEFVIPESREELISVLRSENIRVLGGGSNVLINDKKRYEKVVCLKEFSREMSMIDHELCYVGASVRNQQLIRWLNENGMGGIEYLASVPGLVGGAIYMNAGKGTKGNDTIGRYVVSVDAYINDRIETLDAEQCGFSHRSSVFQSNDGIILGATFRFPIQSVEEGKEKVKARIEYCRNEQDNSHANFGSVFRKYNGTIMKYIKLLGLRKGNVAFSKKTNNWIINLGDGTYSDAKKLIDLVVRIHKLLRKDVSLEVKIWD